MSAWSWLRPFAVLTACAVAAALWLGMMDHPATDRSVVWVFDPASASSYERHAEVRVVPSRYLALRLQLREMARSGGSPRLAEVELSSGELLSSFDTLHGAFDTVLPARLALWQVGGDQKLLPRDVHPVALLYREDLFREAGLEVSAVGSWDELLDLCRAYDRRAGPGRRSIEWPRYSASHLVIRMRQAGLVPRGRGDWDRAALRELVVWYARQAASGVGVDAARRIDLLAADLQSGRVAAAVVADWRYGQLRRLLRGTGGGYRLMELPGGGGATWGGTGVGVPRQVDAEARADAWALLARVYAEEEAWLARWEEHAILPPLPGLWAGLRQWRGDGWVEESAEVFTRVAGRLTDDAGLRLSPEEERALALVLFRAVRAARSGGDVEAVVREGLGAMARGAR